MAVNLEVAFLPATIEPESLADRVVIVVDVLRATTSIVSALQAGAECVIPQPSIEGARDLHARLGECSVMGGERGGKKVDGFQCGNSPPEYSSDVIGGKTLILATTNGTVAMEKCRQAKSIFIGAFVNLGAVVEKVRDEPNITVLCSGTDGHITSEDVLFAGAFVERMQTVEPDAFARDSALVALNHWKLTNQKCERERTELVDFMRTARGGINLVRIGHDHDIVFAAQIDTIPIVPTLDVESWSILADE